LRGLGLRQKLEYARTRAQAFRTRLIRKLWRTADDALRRLGFAIPAALENIEGAYYLRLLRAYRPRYYRGRIALMRAEQQPVGTVPNRCLGWEPLAGEGVDVYPVPGGHVSILTEPNVAHVAVALREALDRSAKRALPDAAREGSVSYRAGAI
jgi:thioesterase domain-containing protein